MRDSKQERSEKLPNRFFRVGETIRLDGVMYEVVERNIPDAMKDRYSLTCKGCDLQNKPCERLQCSRWDRIDGKNVWFVRLIEK